MPRTYTANIDSAGVSSARDVTTDLNDTGSNVKDSLGNSIHDRFNSNASGGIVTTSFGSTGSGASSGSGSKLFRTSASGGKSGIDEIPCYMTNLNTQKTVEFMFTPQTISDNFSSNFEAVDIRGRSSPFQNYSSSSGREISFQVTLYQDYCSMGLLETVNAVKSMAYPFYGATILPPKVYFRVGNFIRMIAICSNVSVEWEKPYKEGIYSKAEISITLTEINKEANGALEVQKDVFSAG